MKQPYILSYDDGYGEYSWVEEFENLGDAEEAAYVAWRDAMKRQAEYSAKLATAESIRDETFEDPADWGFED